MAKPINIFSHWSQMIQGLEVSSTEFYDALERVITSKRVPDTICTSVSWHEGGILSARRRYLRVRRNDHAFDICCAKFGNGTFFSWWLGNLPSGLLAFLYAIPILSWVAYFFERIFKPETYYKLDSMMMFQSLVHAAVLELIDEHSQTKGLHALSESERKPNMKDLFAK